VATTNSTVLERFGENLKRERQSKGLSQDVLAAKAGLSRTVPGLLEHAEREVKIGTIVRLAQALDIPPGRLLDGL
jgi:transcriptional regulator with XRE-family HTH domain